MSQCPRIQHHIQKKNNGSSVTFYLPSIGTWNVKAMLDDQETSGSVTVDDYKEYTTTLQYKTLNDYTWKEIAQFSANGQASSMFSVGDEKEIELNGTVGTVSLNKFKINIFIIGFNHNENYEGKNKIHFLLGRKDNNLIALVDSNYGKKTTSETAFTMSTTDVAAWGGWQNTHMRSGILGSDKAPTSQTGNTLLATFPSDLKAVMQPITKWTDGKYNTNDPYNEVTSSKEYLPLLANYEVFGTGINASDYMYQKQYEYFKSGGKIFYKHTSTSTACDVYLRSPTYSWSGNNSHYFCIISSKGVTNSHTPTYSSGISVILAV